MKNKIAFLLGSGISIQAGFPTTHRITERILSGDDIYHFSDGTYYFGDKQPYDIYVQRVATLLRILKLEIDHYFVIDGYHQTNYEELMYVINQINDSALGEYENPLVGVFIAKISSDLDKINQNYPDNIISRWTLRDFFENAKDYIHDIVWRMLIKDNVPTDYLEKTICAACRDDEFDKVNIFTLNHDTLLETVFKSEGISINTGFGQEINKVRYFNTELLEDSEIKVRLLKLHGSIDWFKFGKNEYSSGIDAIGIPPDWDCWHTINPSGKRQYPAGGRPLILVGTFNKMLQYTSGIFADLYCLFRQSLKTTHRLIVCGYGFGDKGINSQLIEWMGQSNENHLIIIHNEPEKLLKGARGAIQNNWQGWLKNNRLIKIRSLIQDISWSEIKRQI
jgi:hypothetical protein